MVVCQPAAVWFPISSPREGAHPRPGARLVRLGRGRAELPVDLPQPRFWRGICVSRLRAERTCRVLGGPVISNGV